MNRSTPCDSAAAALATHGGAGFAQGVQKLTRIRDSRRRIGDSAAHPPVC